jgi:hypothetical protein
MMTAPCAATEPSAVGASPQDAGIRVVGDPSPAVFGWTDPVLPVEVTALP